MKKVSIELAYHGQGSDVVLGMYIDSEMIDDIQQVGWNMCKCDNQMLARFMGDISIIATDVGKKNAKIIINIAGQDSDLIERSIQEYLDGFEYSIRSTALGLQSRTGEKYEFFLKQCSHEIEVIEP